MVERCEVFAQAVHEMLCLWKNNSLPSSPEKLDLVGVVLGFCWGFVRIGLGFCWDWIGVLLGLGWGFVGVLLGCCWKGAPTAKLPQNSAMTANKFLPPSVHCWAHEPCQTPILAK